jgi:hypothetical protein
MYTCFFVSLLSGVAHVRIVRNTLGTAEIQAMGAALGTSCVVLTLNGKPEDKGVKALVESQLPNWLPRVVYPKFDHKWR